MYVLIIDTTLSIFLKNVYHSYSLLGERDFLPPLLGDDLEDVWHDLGEAQRDEDTDLRLLTTFLQ